MFASPACMLLVWGPQHILFANDACCAALGLPAHRVQGQPAASLTGLPWATLRPFIEQALAGQRSQCESMPVLREQAETRWWALSCSPLHDSLLASDSQIEGALCVIHDQEGLRALNDSLEQRVIERTRDRDRIWQMSTDLMLVAHFDGIIHALNPAWSSVMGWDEQQLLGTDFMHLVHPDDVEPTRDAMTRLAHGLRIADFKNRYRHANGSYRTIAWAAVPDQQFAHAVGRDIQEQVEASEALRVSEESLRQAQKLEAIGQLTGGVAHDFNNLLTVIKSCTDLLKPADLPEAKRAKYVQAISSTVDRAARLTGQLLAFARRQALQPQVFDINESVSRIGEMMDILTGSRIQVNIELPAEPCHIYADGSQFDTALINMVVNARDAMAGVGHLSIRVERVDRSMAAPLPTLTQGDYVSVALTDTGSGIAADKLGIIFEPFYTTKAIGEGTGLGLSQVFGFAKQSGGEVAVYSQLGSGSRFTLYLPSAAEPPALPAQTAQPAASMAAGLRVLMVEDNAEIGTYTSAMLEQSGFEVSWVPAAEEALQLLRRDAQCFDVVFSDIAMPGMSGIELYAEIEAAWPGLPVILTTGYSTEFADFSRGESQRFKLLQKPYRIEDLCAHLHASVRQHHG
ncbi:hybrid sensor histidine kinase/response regulator [Pseudomonas sp. 3A(2025)]